MAQPQADAQTPTREPWVLVFAMVFPSIITYVYFVVLADRPSEVQQVAGATLKLLQFALPLVWLIWGQRGRPTLPELTRHGLTIAMIFGVAAAIALVLFDDPLLRALGTLDIARDAVREKVSELGFINRASYLGLAAFYTLVHSLLEEYYWRWFVYGRLRNHASAPLANLISSVAFMGHHIIVLSHFFGATSLTTWLCSWGVGLGGVVWAWMYERTDRIFPVWVSHAMVDAAIFAIGYFFVFST